MRESDGILPRGQHIGRGGLPKRLANRLRIPCYCLEQATGRTACCRRSNEDLEGRGRQTGQAPSQEVAQAGGEGGPISLHSRRRFDQLATDLDGEERVPARQLVQPDQLRPRQPQVQARPDQLVGRAETQRLDRGSLQERQGL